MLVLRAELAVEPAREIEKRLDHGLFRAVVVGRPVAQRAHRMGGHGVRWVRMKADRSYVPVKHILQGAAALHLNRSSE